MRKGQRTRYGDASRNYQDLSEVWLKSVNSTVKATETASQTAAEYRPLFSFRSGAARAK
jgi:hypothetical protein